MAPAGSVLEEELSSRFRGLCCPLPRQWLQDFISQNPLASADDCYQALLKTDLSCVGLFSIPNNLFPIKPRGTLRGSLLLQIVSILDVGSSAFSQLSQLEGTLNANNEVSAEEPANTEREPRVRGRRCLLLELSDGRCVIRAIEFEPIDCLSSNTPRGSKLLIRGPLEVRRSMIFLRAGSVEMLGGSSTRSSDTNSSQETDSDAEQTSLRKQELQEALQRQRIRHN